LPAGRLLLLAAFLFSGFLRNVIPTYGTTGLTEEIITHLVECRVKRVVLMLDADAAGRVAAINMAERPTVDSDGITRINFTTTAENGFSAATGVDLGTIRTSINLEANINNGKVEVDAGSQATT
jgi:hypothetical protein